MKYLDVVHAQKWFTSNTKYICWKDTIWNLRSTLRCMLEKKLNLYFMVWLFVWQGYLYANLCLLMQSHRHAGALVGFSPQERLQAHQIEIWNTINQRRFVKYYNFKTLHKCKAPYWRLSGDGSVVPSTNVGTDAHKAAVTWRHENQIQVCWALYFLIETIPQNLWVGDVYLEKYRGSLENMDEALLGFLSILW